MIPFRAKYWIVLAEIGIAACALSAEVALWPPPDAEAVAKAQREIREIYGADLARAKKPAELSALAKELIAAAEKLDDDRAAQFALFTAARRLAAQAKDRKLAIAAIGELVDRFEPEETADVSERIKHGDECLEWAKKEPARKRFDLELEAAESYLRAKQTATGLYKKAVERRLGELDSNNESRGAKKFIINATEDWKPTVAVKRGQSIRITATGKWKWGLSDSSECGPEGTPDDHWLQCRIGNGPPIKVGAATSIRATEDGVVSFEMRDSNKSDNSGAISVIVSVR